MVSFNESGDLVNITGRSKGCTRDGYPYLSVQFLSFSCSFRQNPCQIVGFCSKIRDWRLPSGKSWIHHCSFIVAVFFFRSAAFRAQVQMYTVLGTEEWKIQSSMFKV